MNRNSSDRVPDEVRAVFLGVCLLGIATGFARGAGHLSDLAFGVVAYGVPLVFIIWAVLRMNPRGSK